MRGAALVVIAVAGLGLSGCEPAIDISASAPRSAATLPANDGDLRGYAEEWAKKYDADPGEKTASINYARALRSLTRYSEAAAVMQTAAVRSPNDFEVLGEYGKALADSGQLDQAKDVLTRAYPEDRPDWNIMSVQGAVADELGDHEGARKFYRDALKIAPNEPAVLNNLGLSYALTKELPQAESTLREANANAHADARVRENLALVLALEGKFAKAEELSRQDMPAAAADADMRAIKRIVGQSAGASTKALAYNGD